MKKTMELPQKNKKIELPYDLMTPPSGGYIL